MALGIRTMAHVKFEELLSSLPLVERVRLLAFLGHEVTILGRLAYEYHAPGVTNPKLLREINEIQHQIFNLMGSYNRGHEGFLSPIQFLNLIQEKGKGEVGPSLPYSLARAVERFSMPCPPAV